MLQVLVPRLRNDSIMGRLAGCISHDLLVPDQGAERETAILDIGNSIRASIHLLRHHNNRPDRVFSTRRRSTAAEILLAGPAGLLVADNKPILLPLLRPKIDDRGSVDARYCTDASRNTATRLIYNKLHEAVDCQLYFLPDNEVDLFAYIGTPKHNNGLAQPGRLERPIWTIQHCSDSSMDLLLGHVVQIPEMARA